MSLLKTINNMPLRRKLAMSMIAVALPLVIVAQIMYFYTGRISNKTDQFVNEQLKIMVLSENVDENSYYAINVYERFVKEGKSPNVKFSKEQMASCLSSLKELGNIISLRSDYDSIKVLYDKMKSLVDEIQVIYDGLKVGNIEQNFGSENSVQDWRYKFDSQLSDIVHSQQNFADAAAKSGHHSDAYRYYRNIAFLEEFASVVNASVNKEWAKNTKFLSENIRKQNKLRNEIAEMLTGNDLEKFSNLSGILEKYLNASVNYNEYVAEVLDDIESLVSLSSKVTEVSYSLQAAANNMVFNSAYAINDSLNASKLYLLIGILACILNVICILSFCSKSIVKPLEQDIEIGSRLSSGDLTIAIDHTEQTDEIGKLHNSVATMIDNLQNIVSSIRECASEISTSSAELNSASSRMSQSANDQAAGAEEVSSSVEEMASGIAQNSDNATKTESIALNASAIIKDCSDAANSSVVAMNDIASKISIIDDIAFQTNILALNAAVEAARAGDQGKGFAVVAAEVRKLAEKCAVAAREINQVSLEGQKAAADAGNAFAAVLPEMDRTTILVREITAACHEQASGSDQINTAVQRFNMTTQQFASISQEMEANSNNLSTQSERLMKMMSYFKL